MGNIFAEIAKLLLWNKLERNLKQAKTMIQDEDPSLAATMDAIKFYNEEAAKKLENFCKRNPSSILCKDLGKFKGK